MSNCINFPGNPQVAIPAIHIDAQALMAHMEAHKDHKGNSHEHCSECWGTPYWFLIGCSGVTSDGAFLWDVGQGRSTHTSRDFRATLDYLSKFTKHPTIGFRLDITDEGDGHQRVHHTEFFIQKEEAEVVPA